MKKLTFILGCLMILTDVSWSQEKFASYDNNYAKKTYDIQITFKGEEFSLYVDALSLDGMVDNGGFLITQKQFEGFISNLNYAKQKYAEWVNTAKANNVTKLDKTIDLKSQRINGYFLYGDEWKFDFFVTPTFDFKITDNEGTTKHLLIVRTNDMEASSNEYMDCDGFVLVFTSTEEITTFLDQITINKITSFKDKPKQDDLFK